MARIAPTMLRVLFAAMLTTAAGVASALTYQQLADCMAKGIAPAQCSGNAVTPLPGSGTAPNSVLQATGAPRPQGALIRLPDTGATFVVDGGGAKRWITNPQVFAACGLDWNRVQNLSQAEIDSVPNGPKLGTAVECMAARGALPAGALVRVPETGAVYVMDAAGQKRWVTSPQVFAECGLDWNRVQNLLRADLDRVRDGAQLGTGAACRIVVATGR